MKSLSLILFCATATLQAQTLSQKLEKKVDDFEKSTLGKVASLGFYVVDQDGKEIYQHNAEKGLTTASTQKIFTSAAAFGLLGEDFHFETKLSYSGNLAGGNISGDLIVTGGGDPTLGSWRWDTTKPEVVFGKILNFLQSKGIQHISGRLVIDDLLYDLQPVPGGWPWNDIGNYYGAGVYALNWRENQFDLKLKNGKIQSRENLPENAAIYNDLKTSGNSDKSLIYTSPYQEIIQIDGAVPAKEMTISGATPNPMAQFARELRSFLLKNNIKVEGETVILSEAKLKGKTPDFNAVSQPLGTIMSPPLREISRFFLKKSINLYGESLIKFFSRNSGGTGRFSHGVEQLKKYWTTAGLPAAQINFADGSGLSPQNYVSAKAEVMAINFAKKNPWFPDWYSGFPKQSNGMTMKSGTMKDVKSFAGVNQSKSGKTYTFSIIVNNLQTDAPSEILFDLLEPLKE